MPRSNRETEILFSNTRELAEETIQSIKDKR